MNKTELIAAVADRTGLTKKDAEKAVSTALETITAALVSSDKVQLAGFGSFEVKTREARVGRNPRTNEAMEIPASKAPIFKPSKMLKDAVGK